jgi:UDPglucose 6-dehydrogenase
LTKEIYQSIPKNNPPIVEMSLTEAEVSKVSLNAYLVTKISFANFLSNLCEKIDDVNVDKVTNAIGFHKPISPYFLKGGLSFGGTCFPRDTWAFIELSKQFGLEATQLIATDEINQSQNTNLYKKVISFNKKSISILGLSFKPHTPVITESPSIKLIENLLTNDDIDVNVYDPLCLDEVKNKFGDKINYYDSTKECFKNGELVVVALQYDEFKSIDDDWKSFDNQTILDCWRFLDENKYTKINYECLGKKRG